MSDMPNPVEPLRESIAPRHESLAKAFHGDLGPRPLEYGEARLWIVARDPRSLFAYWQFVPGEHPEAHARFSLRIIDKKGIVEAEADISPDQGNIHLLVSHADSEYTAELGFYSASGAWCFIAKSGVAYTPPSDATDSGSAEFVKIPASLPLSSIRKVVQRERPATALARMQRFSDWTAEQEAMFIRLLAADVAAGGKPEGRAARARAKMKPRPPVKKLPQELWAQLDSAGTSSPGETLSSWQPPALPLHVNAELIFYGGTSPDATLTVAGEEVKLRHDGTFRVHTRLPDGEFEIPIVVRSADGARTRKAVLRFSRETEADSGTTASKQPDYLPPAPPVG